MSKVWSKIQPFLSGHQEYFYGLISAVLAFTSPLKTSLSCILALVILDNVAAIFVTIKKGGSIESSKLRRTISKIAIYFTAIVAAFLAETSVVGKEETIGLISKTVIFLISSAELKSLLELASEYLSLQGTKINFWVALLSVLQQKGGSQFNIKTSNKDNDPNDSAPPSA